MLSMFVNSSGVELEPGYGGAAIDGGEVFVLDREIGVAETLRVLDAETGA